MALLVFDPSTCFDWLILILVEDWIDPLVIFSHLKHNVGKGADMLTSNVSMSGGSRSVITNACQFLSHPTGLAIWHLRKINQVSLYYIQTILLNSLLSKGWHIEADSRLIFSIHPCSCEHNSCISAWHRCDYFTFGISWRNGMYTSCIYIYTDIRRRLKSISQSTLNSHVAICRSSGHTKCNGYSWKRACQVFQQHHIVLIGIGKVLLTENIAISTEKCICKIYGMSEVDSATKHVSSCFVQKRLCHQPWMQQNFTSYVHNIKRLKPSTFAVSWSSSINLNGMDAPGWSRSATATLFLSPIPKACREITSSVCTKCPRQRCSRRKIRMELMEACNSRKLGSNCRNIHDDRE